MSFKGFYLTMLNTIILAACNPSARLSEEAALGLPTVSRNGNVQRTMLTYAYLMHGQRDTLMDFRHYGLPEGAAYPSNTFEGRLRLPDVGKNGHFKEVKDLYGYTDSTDVARMHLPPFDYEFLQLGSHIVPLKRGYIESKHPTWEYILEPGRVWDEKSDMGYSRAAVPFTLKQKNQNCVHNGVLVFLFKNDGSISKASYQIASETCGYFKFDMWGITKANYSPLTIDNKEGILKNFIAEVAGRMPTKPIAELSKDYPGAQPEAFSAPKGVTKAHMTLYGFVIDSTNYVGGGNTRQGKYPFLDVLDVPSYSTAKSIAAGMGLMRLEKLYPESSKSHIGDWVPTCAASGNWANVTMENALDMATGNYGELAPMRDEGARHTGKMFLPVSHQQKIEYCCSYYSNKALPGTAWVYHTSDTYVLGTAMNRYLQSKTNNPQADYFSDMIVSDIFKSLVTSPTSWITQRTYDSVAQPFSGYGLFYHHDDVAKIGQFLNNGATVNNQPVLDSTMYSDIMKATHETGLKTYSPQKRYNNGFWLLNLNQIEAMCADDNEFAPYMEGYGGIGIYLLPNNTVYYYFSDNYEYTWSEALKESNHIRSFCSE